ncbi:MAG: J domain-containing protein [Fimbriimonadaceae bacterium]
MRDHYEVLGITIHASVEEVRSAFRKVAREHHPDVSSAQSSVEVFLLAKEAYECLSDPDRRRTYDQTLAHQRKIDQNRRMGDERTRRRVQMASEDRVTSADVLRMTMLLNSHRFREAEAVARQVLRIDGRNPQAYATLAEAAKVRGDLDSAARYFAFAAQYAPDNRVYRERSVQAQEALDRRHASSHPDQMQRNAPIAVGAGVFVVLASSLYVVLAAEPPAFPSVKPIAAWPLSLVFMLLIAGLSVGVSLSIGGFLDVYDANRGSAVMRVPPATALGAVAAVNFWVALAFYVLVGATQNAFNASMSRLMGGVVAALFVLTLAAWNLNSEAAFQTFLWGGNLLYIAAAVGWFVADSLKR